MRIVYLLLTIMMIYWFFLILPILLPIFLILALIIYMKFRKMRREMYHFEESSYQEREGSIQGDVIDVEFTEREE